MTATERITMTMRELDRFKVIQDVADGKLKPWRAAERLELTTRQIRRLVARLREHGPARLVLEHRSKPGNRRLAPGPTAARASPCPTVDFLRQTHSPRPSSAKIPAACETQANIGPMTAAQRYPARHCHRSGQA
ncbi:integrase [Burkholderia aenigmatica]|uniref:Integrase n=1 Tax=Burkholderia aenigmatica TaxID=2015348 RepID=A0ABY6XUU2_9BURK|nr:helix-turn-helix domain-containing protein [Burkholderia aenigmatica]VWC64535.1 integrase [Burkholderia aenigmatica]VWC86177.1 integrase [Burkholderia aenigmatica]